MYRIIVSFLLLAAFPGPLVAQDSTALDWVRMGQAQQLAEKEQKKVLVYSQAEWCTYCKKMEREVFPQQSVRDSLYKYFIPVDVDIESDLIMNYNGLELTQREFAMRHRVTATPTFIFLDSKGNVMGVQPGFIPSETFKMLLGFVGSGAHRDMKFEEYRAQRTGEPK